MPASIILTHNQLLKLARNAFIIGFCIGVIVGVLSLAFATFVPSRAT